MVDADRKFLYINAGAPGAIGNAGLFRASEMWSQIEQGLLRTTTVPVVVGQDVHRVTPNIVGDSAFPLHEHVLKNYDISASATRRDPTKKEFNRRLTDCRRLSEMAFGVLKGRWPVCAHNLPYCRPEVCTVESLYTGHQIHSINRPV